MELELQKASYEHYQSGAAVADFHEESAETIVPDHSPDIARIVDVSACLLRRGAEQADGRVTVTGTVRLTLLYLAEGESRLRSLAYAIPFEHTPDARFPEDAILSVEGRVCNAEARLLNPRKLSTRLELNWKITPYRRAELTLCSGIAEQAQYAIETLRSQQNISLIESVYEKDFSFTDELTLPGGRDAIGALLSADVTPRITECRTLGSKVVLKGAACLSLLYSTEGGQTAAYSEELPFSQILDGLSEEGGEWNASAALSMTGCEVHTAEDGGRTVHISLQLSAFVVLRRSLTVDCVTDLYSTAWELEPKIEARELRRPPQVSVLSQTVREQLDTGSEVSGVLSASVCFGAAELRQEGGSASARVAANVKALVLDGNGAPLSVRRRVELTAETEARGEADVETEPVCAGDITASINAGGVELRFPVNFTVAEQQTVSCPTLLSLSAEPSEGGGENVPSLVLRALKDGERLWDLAKQYRATVEDILSANDLADESAAELGRLLLIPRKR